MRCTTHVNPKNNYFKTVNVFCFFCFCAFDCWRVLTGFQTACLRLTFSSFVSFFHNFITIKTLPKHSHNVSSYRFKMLLYHCLLLPIHSQQGIVSNCKHFHSNASSTHKHKCFLYVGVMLKIYGRFKKLS